MYDPCSKNNILWNRATMQALDLSSSFAIPKNPFFLKQGNGLSCSLPIKNKDGTSSSPDDNLDNSDTMEKERDLDYFRFGTEQLYVGDLLRLDLVNNFNTKWIKTINHYERVDKHEYLEVQKITEIRNKNESIIEITGPIYFNIFAESTHSNQDKQDIPFIATFNAIASTSSSTSSSSTSIAIPQNSTHNSSAAKEHLHPSNSSSSINSLQQPLSTYFLSEKSDILWFKSDEIRTVRLDEICGRYYTNCPTLERKMRISSEKEWNQDYSVF